MIRDFHAHIYFDAAEVEQARALGDAAHECFGVPVGHYHLHPVGPHPRGSVQLTVPAEQFGELPDTRIRLSRRSTGQAARSDRTR